MKNKLIPSLMFLFLLSPAFGDNIGISTSPVTTPLSKAMLGGSLKSEMTKAGIYDMGGKLFIDRNLEVSKGIRGDRYLELVSTATPLPPAVGFARFYMSQSSNTLCAEYSTGGVSCFGFSSSTGTVIAAPIIAHDPLKYNIGTGDLTLNPISLSTGVTGTLADTSLSSNVALRNSTQTFTGINTFTSSVTIQNTRPLLSTSTLQIGTTFYVSSGTVSNNLYVGGNVFITNNASGNEADFSVGRFSAENYSSDFRGTGYTTAQSVRLAPTGDSLVALVIQNSAETHTILDIDSTNNRVGINTETPASTLDVSGNIKASYEISIGSITGAGLSTCGDTSHALAWSSSNNQFSCQSISGSGAAAQLASTNTWTGGNTFTSSVTFAGAVKINSLSNTILAVDSAGLVISTTVTSSGPQLTSTQTWSGANTFTSSTTIKGTITNDNAATGNLGEYIESIFSGVAFPGTGVYGDATSIVLSTGDWDVSLNILFSPGAGLTSTNWSCGISQTTGNSTTGLTIGSNWGVNLLPDNTNGVNNQQTIAVYRQSLSTTTTIYAKFSATYTLGGPAAYGRLSARRVR